MPILNQIDYKTLRGRVAIGAIYALLSLGGVVMVYPFLVMVAMSFTNEVDVSGQKLWPEYILNEELLYRKYLGTRYLSFQEFLGTRHLNRNYLTRYYRFEELADTDKPILTPEIDPSSGLNRPVPLDIDSPVQRQRALDWQSFSATLPESHVIPGSLPWLTPLYHQWIKEKYRTMPAVASAYGEAGKSFISVTLPFYNPYIRTWQLEESRKTREWVEFFSQQDGIYRIPLRLDGEYQRYLSQTYGDVDELNRLSGQKRRSLEEYRLQATRPLNEVEAAWWDAYVARRIPYPFLDARSITPAYQQWLAQKYHHDIAALNASHGTDWPSFDAIPYSVHKPEQTAAAALWSQFTTNALPLGTLRLDTVEARWDQWLRAKYGNDPQALSKAHGLAVSSIENIYLPIAEGDRLTVRENRRMMTKEYLLGNYIRVINYLLLEGRAFLNTGILCAAMILSQLTINPFCAYALSRFSLGYKYTIILFFIATMAFPAEVMMIPNFLNLKTFGLLNTYWALILPSLVSGYYIFIMKGFFDSLGKELFEAAQIDGAGEIRMFFQIAVPLSKPIFAVKALNAFMAAYGGFLWAFLVCQDESLWTVMVHLYSFQQTQPQSVVMTTLVVASIPTLLVYVFCQKIIMRGIILPTLK